MLIFISIQLEHQFVFIIVREGLPVGDVLVLIYVWLRHAGGVVPHWRARIIVVAAWLRAIGYARSRRLISFKSILKSLNGSMCVNVIG